MMNRLTFLVPVVLLASCASSTMTTPPAVSSVITRDISTKLTSFYPPARTRFCLGLPVRSAFDVSLTDNLRKKGYSVASDCTNKGALPIYWQTFMNTNKTTLSVSIHVNHTVLSHAWKIAGNTALPINVWTRGA